MHVEGCQRHFSCVRPRANVVPWYLRIYFLYFLYLPATAPRGKVCEIPAFVLNPLVSGAFLSDSCKTYNIGFQPGQ